MESENDANSAQPTRRRLPADQPSRTHTFTISGMRMYLTVVLYPESGLPGEILIVTDRVDPLIADLLDLFAKSISIALQFGVPLEDLCPQFIGHPSSLSGMTDDPRLPVAKSIIDYIFRYLKMTYLDETSEVDTE